MNITNIQNAGHHYTDFNNRKKFFNTFADETGFDPLIPTNWYLLPRESFMKTKVSA
jgi:hypothetical protein